MIWQSDHIDMIMMIHQLLHMLTAVHMLTQSLVFLQWDNLISVVKHSSIILLMWSCQCDEIDMMIWSNCQVIHWVAPPAPLNRDMITSNLMIRSFHTYGAKCNTEKILSYCDVIISWYCKLYNIIYHIYIIYNNLCITECTHIYIF